MTYEEMQKLQQRIDTLRILVNETDLEKERRVIELERCRLRDQEMRVYQINDRFDVNVNPIDDIVWAPWFNSHLRTADGTVPSKVIKGLAMILAIYEDWKDGNFKTMPPSGSLASACERLGITL